MQGSSSSAFTYTEYNQSFVNAGTIWSFWDGNPPELVLQCFETMRMNNPNRPIVILDKATLSLFLSPKDYPLFEGKPGCPDGFSSPQYLADWVRITLLEKYGGVWLDASVICTNPVDTWASSNDEITASKITMFPMHANPNIHGNWAMAADELGHPLLRAWREELATIFNESGRSGVPTEYLRRAFEQRPKLADLWYNPSPPPLPYLWVYLALQVVLQKQPQLHTTINLLPSIKGPMYRRFQYNVVKGITDSEELSQKTADDLASYPLDRDGHDRYFIKLVGKDRHPTQQHLDNKSYEPGSALDDLSRIPAKQMMYGKDLHNLVVPTRRNALLRFCSLLQADISMLMLQQQTEQQQIDSSPSYASEQHMSSRPFLFAA